MYMDTKKSQGLEKQRMIKTNSLKRVKAEKNKRKRNDGRIVILGYAKIEHMRTKYSQNGFIARPIS